ncbi:MAG TPA: penicillin acylase family protein [Chitinophagaceae bacterium]|nr:penicillin acylase family protein [Chitinophagaceae bacterium]
MMNKLIIFFLFIPVLSFSQQFTKEEISKFEMQLKRVTIIRDTWGIPHIYGKTDADAVFGLLYAQCEDDFKRVEMNALENLGRKAEVTGMQDLYNDLQMRLIYDSVAAINEYTTCPQWFRKLLDAAADGVNYYLYKHTGVKPAALQRFQPWYQLMRTNGSISATNTRGISARETGRFYSNNSTPDKGETTFSSETIEQDLKLTGSNGFAVMPSKTKNKNAILYINPHVTFYFRSEVHMVSDEGLNVYGAVTWGQFFVFQGFNQYCGWMHTTGDADLADVYQESVNTNKKQVTYNYDGAARNVKTKDITISYKKDDKQVSQSFTTYATHHGPVMASRNGKWLSLRENNRSLKGLMQSWLRTKAKGYTEFEKIMQMRSNTSDNTVFADNKGNIAYWHGNFIPRRDPKYDWSQPVDGSTSATEWKGIHELNEIVHVHNPSTGWIQNCNSTPFTVSGKASPDKNKYPEYMAPDEENYRAVNAIRLFSTQDNFTLDKMIATGYNTHLAAFDVLLPSLFIAYDEKQRLEPTIKADLDEAIQLLKLWNRESAKNSVATTLAIEWATKLRLPLQKPADEKIKIDRFEALAKFVSPNEKISILEDVIKELNTAFGTWRVTWGEMNRYQRLTSDLQQKFDDSKPSFAVGMASSTWGCLPSFSTVKPAGLQHRYGVNGNSFVAAVEFGKKIKARSIVTGGEGMDPSSKHFLDQAEMYIDGKFKDVLFYKEDVLKHVERKYHPRNPL